MTRQRMNATNVANKRFTAAFSDQCIADLLDAISGEDAVGFGFDYLREEILSKYVGPNTDPAKLRRARAIEKWLAAEVANGNTNERLMHASIVDHTFSFTTYSFLVRKVQKFIRRVLGPLDTETVFASFCYTNGATTRVKRSERAALHKLIGNAHCTPLAVSRWLDIINSDKGELVCSGQDLELVEGNELFTVPKRTDIDRVACKEPEINMLMQRACGVHIRNRLRLFGINLLDQTRNQVLAQRAYCDRLATIDLSSASDSITSVLVQQLLPNDWWSLLYDLRCPTTMIDDSSHELNMFSSMGNGFTFELESLLFFAIVSVIAEIKGDRNAIISVYGDDIIAPSALVKDIREIFAFIGFTMNPKKTHSTGPFRESCGKHYYKGFDVSPFYIREAISTLPDLIRVLNRVLEWDGRGFGFMTTPRMAAFHRKYSAHVPPKFWGGVETDQTDALVTGHAPRYRITAKVKELHFDQDAACVHWLMQKEHIAPSGSRVDTASSFGCVIVSPTREIELKAARSSMGWHTTWRPWLIC